VAKRYVKPTSKTFKMKYFFLLIIILFALKTFPEDRHPDDIPRIKQAMVLAVENSRITDSLYADLIKRKAPSALILAYTGTLEALKAKHSWNPYQKISYVARSQKTLQKAVIADPENLEIRFMRFSTQHYTPAFLGYSKEIELDRKMIIHQYSQKAFGKTNPELIKSIAGFLISSNRCTSQEVTILKKFI
jgi:hypothetical protein